MISINTNSSSSLASLNLQRASDLLQKSLSRLSSGSRISAPQDDAGGLAVSLKLSSAVKRSQSAATSVSNALSLLQVQAGSLKSAASVLDRLSELATLGSDVTKSSTDIANYCTEFNALVSELNVLASDSFNGISLFSSGATTGSLTVYLAQDGSQSMAISQGTLQNSYSSATAFASVTAGGVSGITSAVQNLATLMAQNGAEASRLQFALDSLT